MAGPAAAALGRRLDTGPRALRAVGAGGAAPAGLAWQTLVVMVKPGGTFRPRCAISQRLAPLPPSCAAGEGGRGMQGWAPAGRAGSRAAGAQGRAQGPAHGPPWLAGGAPQRVGPPAGLGGQMQARCWRISRGCALPPARGGLGWAAGGSHQGLHLLAPRAAALLEDIDALLLRGGCGGWDESRARLQAELREGAGGSGGCRLIPLAARDQPAPRCSRADQASQHPSERPRRQGEGAPPRHAVAPNPTQNHLRAALRGLLGALERLLHRANDASERAGHFVDGAPPRLLGLLQGAERVI